jgi:hypothetical protein
MILYLDENGCATTRDRAVFTLFGVPEWVGKDIAEYGTKYCCWFKRIDKRTRLGTYECSGMMGVRNFTVETYMCRTASGRDFVLNVDDISSAELPLVCMRRYSGRYSRYDVFNRWYGHMLNIVKSSKCKNHCVIDEDGRIVVFGDDLYKVVDSWATLMRKKSISVISVLV